VRRGDRASCTPPDTLMPGASLGCPAGRPGRNRMSAKVRDLQFDPAGVNVRSGVKIPRNRFVRWSRAAGACPPCDRRRSAVRAGRGDDRTISALLSGRCVCEGIGGDRGSAKPSRIISDILSCRRTHHPAGRECRTGGSQLGKTGRNRSISGSSTRTRSCILA
jgi:hypothetical protein